MRPRVLLGRWTQDYSFRTSNTQVSWFLAPRGIDNALCRIPSQVPVALNPTHGHSTSPLWTEEQMT